MPDKDIIVELLKRIKILETDQEKTRSAQKALVESEERFRLISETIHFGVFELDQDRQLHLYQYPVSGDFRCQSC